NRNVHTSVMHCMFFFFSSRRRHTRLSRDWSSDVCSTDHDKTFADIQLATDWLKARMEERISRVLFVNEKVPYDNIGISMIVEPKIGRASCRERVFVSVAGR